MSKSITVTTEETRYYGIHLHCENNKWWIVCDDGGEEYFGNVKPTAANVDYYRNNNTEIAF